MNLKIKIFLIASLFYSCGENLKPIATDNAVYNYPEQESWNSVVTFSDSGFTRAVLTAGHLMKFENSTKTQIDENMKVEFYDQFGKLTSTLVSNSGWADETSKDLFAKGDVKVVSIDGIILESEELNWNNTNQKVLTDKFVTIITKSEYLQGFGFESDQGLKNYKIFKVSGLAKTK